MAAIDESSPQTTWANVGNQIGHVFGIWVPTSSTVAVSGSELMLDRHFVPIVLKRMD